MIELAKEGRFGRLASLSVPVTLVFDFFRGFLEEAKAKDHLSER
jgi:hypothetical protein